MNSRNGEKILFTFPVWTVVFVFFTVSILSGCEPLRKKFTRKKKEETQETQPLLEPVDYPEKVETPESIYRYRYSLWQAWYTDTMTTLDENGSDKRILNDLNQLSVQVEELKKVFSGEKGKLLAGFSDRLEGLKKSFSRPPQLRDKERLRSDINSLDKKMRQNFTYKQVQGILTQPRHD